MPVSVIDAIFLESNDVSRGFLVATNFSSSLVNCHISTLSIFCIEKWSFVFLNLSNICFVLNPFSTKPFIYIRNLLSQIEDIFSKATLKLTFFFRLKLTRP